MAIFPWIRAYKAQQVPLGDFPAVKAWFERILARPATHAALDLGKELRAPALTDEARKALFGQTAQSIKSGEHKLR